MFAIRVEDRGAFRAAAEALKGIDHSLNRDLGLVIRRKVQPVIQAQRAAVRGLRVSGVSGSSGLRGKVASGVRYKMKLARNPEARIVTTMRDGRLAFAPRGFDTSFNGWRAPLFGDRHRWYRHNMSGPSWFMAPAAAAQPELQTAIIRILKMAATDIANKATAIRGS